MTEPQPPPADRVGQLGGVVKIVQSLTLTHVLIIALLVAIAVPAFILYRFMTDASMLNKWTSFYEELTSDKVPCTLRVASVRGADPVYSISTGFAFQGSDRWTVGVILTHGPPDEGELVSYCETLNAIVDYMRRPNAPSPHYPNSDEDLIWRYPPGEQP
jgi:hypothetical protein